MCKLCLWNFILLVRADEKELKKCTENAPQVLECRRHWHRSTWLKLVVIISIILPVFADEASKTNVIQNSFDQFTIFKTIKPTLSHGPNERDIYDTRIENGLHADNITLRYTHDSRDVVIDLKLNENLIPNRHFLRYQSANGSGVVRHFTKNDIDLCHYKGTVRNNPNASHVAISTCNGIKGVVFDGDEMYHIDTKPKGNISDEHYLYRHSDIVKNQRKDSFCGFKKQNDVAMASVAPHDIRLGMFVPLNIFVCLTGVVVWNKKNEIEISRDAKETLDRFLKYRETVLLTQTNSDSNDIAMLLTQQTFADRNIGLAYLFSMCSNTLSGLLVRSHVDTVGRVATTVAHELGHTLGMDHDTSDCKCERKQCIMEAEDSIKTIFHWSSCSIDQLNLGLQSGMDNCLWNKPTQLFDMNSPQCGNSFVEPGEECDCGMPDFCQNSCCNPNTCTLRSNASCASGECCDLTTCDLRTAGTVCRTADGECDLPEFCTGESEYCPQDNFKRDTELCDGNKAYCYEGTCESHDDRCKFLWGSTGKSVDECYIHNLYGNMRGNCGIDRDKEIFFGCVEEDVKCGLMQCTSLNESLKYGNELRIYQGDRSEQNGCQTVAFYLNLQSFDPGLAPNGSICGEGKMCYGQRCLSIESLRAKGTGVDCPENCNGHGICNNQGQCHCDTGFEQPLCKSPGNDGHALILDGSSVFVRIIHTIFFGVVYRYF